MEETFVLIVGGVGGPVGGPWPLYPEIYPAVSGCFLPALPKGRNLASTFVTTGPSPKVVTCGGGYLASCLVLDVDNQRWDENMMDELPQPRGYHAAVSVEDIGTYLIGGGPGNNKRTSDFLAEGTTEWVAGPALPVDMNAPCAVKISNLTFLVIHGTEILEYQVDITNPTSNSGWQSSSKWPQMQTSRGHNPGCSKIENYIVIAGGYDSGQFLRSTEVLNLSTRIIVAAGDLNTPRAYFHLATITRDGQQQIFAIGGFTGSSNLNSVEKFNLSNNTWTQAPTNLVEAKRMFGAVTLQRELICTT